MVGYRVCMHTIYSPVESYAEICKWMNTACVIMLYQYIYFHIMSCKAFSKREK